MDVVLVLCCVLPEESQDGGMSTLART